MSGGRFAHGHAGWVSTTGEEAVYCDDDAGVYVVADGVGPPKAREAAARLFCDTVKRHRELLRGALSGAPGDKQGRERALKLIQWVFDRAADRIYSLAQRRAGYGGMATTAVLLAVGPAGAAVGHVGDTRAYLLREDALDRLTEDHSLADDMLQRGMIADHEREDFPARSVLSRAVGHSPRVTVDTLWLDVSEGDAVPLCSYGLYRSFSDLQLRDLLKGGIDRIIRAAIRRGGEEEATAIVVRVGAGGAGERAVDTASKLRVVRKLQLFRFLSDQELVRLLKIVYERTLEPGEVLIREGEPGDAIFIVYSGALDVSKASHHLTVIERGGHLGEIAFMDGQARSATVTATRRTTILTFSRDDFRELAKTEPLVTSKVLWSFMLNLGGRIRELTLQYARASRD